jgi:hypothetical protein
MAPTQFGLAITRIFFTICGRGFQPADAGGSIKPGVERSGTPGAIKIYRTSPRSGRQPLTSMMMKWRMTKSCRPLRGLDAYLRHIPGVPLTLHPRLYSAARIRGLRTRHNVSNDKAIRCRVFPSHVHDPGDVAGKRAPLQCRAHYFFKRH